MFHNSLEHIEFFIYLRSLSFKTDMFFFGAFSGNLIYLILAISYMAGFSTLAFRSTDVKEKEIKSTEACSAQIIYNNTSSENAVQYYIINSDHTNQALTEEIPLQSPVTVYSTVLFIPPPLSCENLFSGSALFSRPPPFSLV